MIRALIFIISMMITLSFHLLPAEIIQLKTGEQLEGKVVSETRQVIILDVGDGQVVISKEDIDSFEDAVGIGLEEPVKEEIEKTHEKAPMSINKGRIITVLSVPLVMISIICILGLIGRFGGTGAPL